MYGTDDKNHIHYINIRQHLETSIRNPTEGGDEKHQDLNMFCQVDFLDFFPALLGFM